MTQQRGREGLFDPPYTGVLGATRREFAFVPTPEGAPRRVELVRGVNAVTDPQLARQAAEGVLHRYGELDLAVTYIYHDPAARRFALVVPLARAHEELTLRAEFLSRLAAEATEILPGYVREARTVIASAGLRRYLDEYPHGTGRSSGVPPALWEGEGQQREDRLHRMAQEVAEREDDVHARIEAMEAERENIALRERGLDQRLSDLVAREEAVAEEERMMRASMAALASREVLLHAREEDLADREEQFAQRVHRQAVANAGVRTTEVDPTDDEAMELDPDEQTGRVQLSDAPVAAAADGDLLELQPDEVAELDANARLSMDDVAGMGQRDNPGITDEAGGDSTGDDGGGAAQWVARGGRAYAAVVEGEVGVWLQGDPELAQQMATGGVSPVLQADPDGALPLALLAIQPEGAEPVCRVVLDFTRPDDRAVLEGLGRDFRVRVEVVSAGGRALGSYAVSAPCEREAQRVLDLLAGRDVGTTDARQAEAARWVEAGLHADVGDAVDPIGLATEQALSTAAGVAVGLAAYAPLLDPIRLDRLTLARGLSSAQVESVGKRLALAALRTGVPLSGDFVQRAVTLGVAPDARTLAARALTAFARTLEGGVGAIGRTPSEASHAWRPLLSWALAVGATIPEAARAAITMLYDPDDPESVAPPDDREAPAPEDYAGMPDAELVGWIQCTAARLPAARELARRDAAKWGEALGRALRMLPAPMAAELAAEIVRGGDAGGDIWVQLVGSDRPVGAAIGAVGAAVVRQRRALNPVIQRALARDTMDDWRLFGWAAGEFGAAVVKVVARQEKPAVDRLAWVLGHAVRCGAARELERARTGATELFVDAATRALGLQDEVRAYDEALRRGEGATVGERMAHVLLRRSLVKENQGLDGSTVRT